MHYSLKVLGSRSAVYCYATLFSWIQDTELLGRALTQLQSNLPIDQLLPSAFHVERERA